MKVVLLHSALGDSRLWRRQVEVLSAAHEVVTPDLPGWGESPLPTEPFSFVEAVAEHLPAALVGNSFGGAVALRTALAKQELVPRLVVIAAALPTWDWSETMRNYWAAEEAAVDAGDLDLATQVNLDFWVRPSTRRCGPSSGGRSSCRRRTRSQVVAGAGALDHWRSRRSSSSVRTTRLTSARSRTIWQHIPTRSSRSSPAPAISSASTSRTR